MILKQIGCSIAMTFIAMHSAWSAIPADNLTSAKNSITAASTALQQVNENSAPSYASSQARSAVTSLQTAINELNQFQTRVNLVPAVSTTSNNNNTSTQSAVGGVPAGITVVRPQDNPTEWFVMELGRYQAIRYIFVKKSLLPENFIQVINQNSIQNLTRFSLGGATFLGIYLPDGIAPLKDKATPQIKDALTKFAQTLKESDLWIRVERDNDLKKGVFQLSTATKLDTQAYGNLIQANATLFTPASILTNAQAAFLGLAEFK